MDDTYMKKILSVVERQLLALIKLGIMVDASDGMGMQVDECLVDNVIDWHAVHALAKGQALIALSFLGLERYQKLLEERNPGTVAPMPDPLLLLDWLEQAELEQAKKWEFDAAMEAFDEVMAREQITYVVFKGLAAASKYPRPDVRTMGDIDFYVPATDFDRAVEIIERELDVEMKKDEVDKHFSFSWRNIHFEMHYQMETFGCKRFQKYFGKLVDEHLEGHSPVTFVTQSGKHIPMLPPDVDLMLVMKHLCTHLLGEGVGLRQMTDVAVLIQSCQNEIDVVSLRKKLDNIGYLKAMDVMVRLVDRYYGIAWPAYGSLLGSEYNRQADRLMVTLMKNGNFGRSDYKNHEGWSKRMETTLRFFRHCLRFGNLAPWDILCLIPKRISISLKAH